MTHATAKRITIRRPPEGTVLVIPLGDGTYGFGQVAVGGYAYFDLRSQNILSVDEIIASPIAFAVLTSEGVAKAAGWLHLGVATLKGRLAVDQSYRSQPVGSNQLYIYKGTQLLGDPLLPVQHDQAKDLELYISWSAEDVVQRLLDHFSSRPNAMVERFKKIKVYDPKTGVELDPKTGQDIKRAELRQAPNEPSPACVPIEPDKSKPKTPTAATLEKLRELVDVYDRLVVLLRNEGDERLKAFTDSVDGAITQLKALVAAGTDAKTSREMVAGIRQGLHETPQLLSALVPECSKRLVADIERKLGHRFSDF